MTPEEHKLEHRRLQELTHRNLMELIDSELSLADTMSDLAETEAELGDDSHARTLLGKVSEAMDCVRRHMGDHQVTGEEKRDIEARLRDLTRRLDATKPALYGEP